MSELGMDSRGDVRTAYEFKDIFDDTGVSHRPYKCPFCEVQYEDRCIVTDCVKAPHFKLPNGTAHRGNCDGEPETDSSERGRRPSSVVVGDVEVPEALVARRPARKVRQLGDSGDGRVPSDSEIGRRREALSGERTLASKFTSSLLRAIVAAHKRLMKLAFESAVAAGHKKGSPEYKGVFKSVLESRPLELFGQKLTYRSAFLTSKLSPTPKPRIYSGSGTVGVTGPFVQITDIDAWPKEFGQPDRTAFTVSVARALPGDAVAAHDRAVQELLALAGDRRSVRWWAYGAPELDAMARWVLPVESLDHIYWEAVP